MTHLSVYIVLLLLLTSEYENPTTYTHTEIYNSVKGAMYIYMYTHTYIYTYIHIYVGLTHLFKPPEEVSLVHNIIAVSRYNAVPVLCAYVHIGVHT